jgi:hypothetical protein
MKPKETEELADTGFRKKTAYPQTSKEVKKNTELHKSGSHNSHRRTRRMQ